LSDKKTLRKIYLAKRMQLSPEEYAELNGQLLGEFKQLDLTGIECIHIYLPIPSKKEPDTSLLIGWLKQAHPGIKLVYPKTNFADHSMQHFLDDAALKIADTAFVIPEPIAGNEVAVADIDLVIVPLLVFDKRGYRVGYGKGFYDRFMAQCKPTCRFIGLSFFEPVDAIDDLNEHDLPLHQCITPGKIWRF
jgi:5-formyltetrahydrofolate cyclo-ligase